MDAIKENNLVPFIIPQDNKCLFVEKAWELVYEINLRGRKTRLAKNWLAFFEGKMVSYLELCGMIDYFNDCVIHTSKRISDLYDNSNLAKPEEEEKAVEYFYDFNLQKRSEDKSEKLYSMNLGKFLHRMLGGNNELPTESFVFPRESILKEVEKNRKTFRSATELPNTYSSEAYVNPIKDQCDVRKGHSKFNFRKPALSGSSADDNQVAEIAEQFANAIDESIRSGISRIIDNMTPENVHNVSNSLIDAMIQEDGDQLERLGRDAQRIAEEATPENIRNFQIALNGGIELEEATVSEVPVENVEADGSNISFESIQRLQESISNSTPIVVDHINLLEESRVNRSLHTIERAYEGLTRRPFDMSLEEIRQLANTDPARVNEMADDLRRQLMSRFTFSTTGRSSSRDSNVANIPRSNSRHEPGDVVASPILSVQPLRYPRSSGNLNGNQPLSGIAMLEELQRQAHSNEGDTNSNG